MSLQPRRLPEVPADTARAAFPRGSLAIRIRDELGEVWSDQRFQSLFGVRGKPGISQVVGQFEKVTGVTVRRGRGQRYLAVPR